jgi:foldase protein PrsA
MKLLPSIFIFAVLLLSSFSDIYSSEIIASWNGGEITQKEFEKDMLQNIFYEDYRAAYMSKIEKRRQYLKDMIIDKQIVPLIEKYKIDTVQSFNRRFHKKVYSIAILENLLFDSIGVNIFSERDINNLFFDFKFRYNLSYITIKSKTGNDKAGKVIKDIYTDVEENNISLSQATKKYNEDPTLSMLIDNVGWISHSKLDSNIADHVLQIGLNEISKPFKSKNGWHIINLKDKIIVEKLKTIEYEKGNLLNLLIESNQENYDKLYNSFVSRVYSRFNYEIMEDQIKAFINKYSTYYSDNTNKESDIFNIFNKDQLEVVLLKYDNKILTVGDLIAILDGVPTNLKHKLEASNIISYLDNIERGAMFRSMVDTLKYTERTSYL